MGVTEELSFNVYKAMSQCLGRINLTNVRCLFYTITEYLRYERTSRCHLFQPSGQSRANFKFKSGFSVPCPIKFNLSLKMKILQPHKAASSQTLKL